MNYDPKTIEQLAKLLEQCNLSEIEITEKDSKIKVARQNTVVSHSVAETPALIKDKETIKQVENKISGTEINSPMVGTVYLSSSPGAGPFVKEGQTVAAGDVLCLIEAMKMFNKIKAEKAGIIKKVIVSNEHPVEFGAPLFIIEEN
ncbi:MAG: acetyl-CoA carboxylase biotin carboxyl carrier protein [Legionellales bacterium]|jgi:acetyl-CoA carboxylase biotin carboxyl carrier protein|nr:acetyl-CoA carboxylase biotin carboxyl carrier protein [Legionellales bacterium]